MLSTAHCSDKTLSINSFCVKYRLWLGKVFSELYNTPYYDCLLRYLHSFLSWCSNFCTNQTLHVTCVSDGGHSHTVLQIILYIQTQVNDWAGAVGCLWCLMNIAHIFGTLCLCHQGGTVLEVAERLKTSPTDGVKINHFCLSNRAFNYTWCWCYWYWWNCNRL